MGARLSPDGGKIALGTGPAQGWTGPLRLAVLSAERKLLAQGSDSFGIWAAAWSVDSSTLAYIHCQSGRYYPPGQSTQENVMLSVLTLRSGANTILYSTTASDRRKDDPITPYELAW